MTFNVVQPIIPISTDERELFHYIMENITNDKTRYNYWVPETSYVSPSLYPYPTTRPLALPGTFRSSSHLYPPCIVSTSPYPSHDFLPS